jgi:hypothetical protein
MRKWAVLWSLVRTCHSSYETHHHVSNHHHRWYVCDPIDELLDVPYEENETKIIRFANYLRMIFTAEPSDLRLLRKASRALGIPSTLASLLPVQY